MTPACPRCGLLHPSGTPCLRIDLAAPPTSTELRPGDMLAGRYRIARRIHRGGMSVVYQAEDGVQGRPLALKELRLPDGATAEEQREAEIWFARESHLLSMLAHPLIPAFYSVFREGGRSYIAQEYLEAENLDDRVARHGAQDERRVLEWGMALCDLLTYLHSLPDPVIFRDLKPANILLRADGGLAVVDFGIARPYAPGEVGTVVGTPGYAPPEQYQGLATPRSDVYALGATLHRLLTGYDPEHGAPFTFPAVRALNPRISPSLAALIERAVQLDPVARPSSAASVRAELADIVAHAQRHAARSALLPHRWVARHRALTGVTTAITAIVLAVHFHRTQPPAPVVHDLHCSSGIPGPRARIYGIAVGPDHQFWLADADGSLIARMGLDGRMVVCKLPTSSFPNAVTAGPGGALWFTEGDGNRVGRLLPSGHLTEFGIGGRSILYGITTGPDGNLWFGEQNGIGRITPQGQLDEFALSADYPDVRGLAAGPDGNVWFTESGANKVGRITPAGNLTEFTPPIAGSGPYAIALGPDGSLWVTLYDKNLIARLTPDGRSARFRVPTGSSEPSGIVRGTDGNLWFTETGGDAIGRITSAGQIREFPLPTDTGPVDITVGPDGALWFTECCSSDVGRISTAGVVTFVHPHAR